MRHFPDFIDSYLEYVFNSEPSSRYKFWCCVSGIAAVLKRKCFLAWHTRVYPNMYIVLIGPAGSRKGTAMGPVYNLLTDLSVPMAAEAITREALIRELNKSTDTFITPEGAVTHSSLTIYSPELAVFLGQNNLALLSDLTDWFDCRDTWTYRTKTQGDDCINGVWVNLLGATTPSILQNSLPQDAIGGGLTSRIVFIFAPGKEKIIPAPFLTKEELELRGKLLEDLQSISLLQGNFTITEGFLERWIQWYTDHERHPPFETEIFAGYCERKPIHALKLSMILNAARTDTMEITVEDLNRAVKALDEAETVMPRVFSGYGRREEADLIPQITNMILAEKVIPKSRLVQRFMTELTVRQLDEILEGLRQCEFIHIDFDTKTGRQTIRCLR